MGATAPKIETAVRACEGFEGSGLVIEHAENMEEAVAKAGAWRSPGISSACPPPAPALTSTPNFEVRGQHFKSIVNSLK